MKNIPAFSNEALARASISLDTAALAAARVLNVVAASS